MKKQTFFKTLVFTLGLALLFLVGFSSCEKDGIEGEEVIATTGQNTYKGNADGKVTNRDDTNCECQYRIVSVTGNSLVGIKFYLTGSEFCSTACYNMSAYNDSCLPLTGSGCDELVASPYPSTYRWFNCSTAPFSSFDVNYQPYSDCGNTNYPYSSSITFQLRCLEKPEGECDSGQYIYSNPYTISAAAFSGGTAEVNMVECGCEPQITAP